MKTFGCVEATVVFLAISIPVLLTPTISSAQSAPPDVSMVIESAAMPYPILTGSGFSAEVSIEFTNPATGQEIQPPSGTSYSWTCTGVSPSGSGLAASSISFGSPSSQSTTVAGSASVAGSYSIYLQCAVSNASWTTTPVFAYDELFDTWQNVVVTFNPFAFGLGLGTKWGIGATESGSATVQPASQAPNVAIEVTSGPSCVSFSNISPNATTGVITFTVNATSASPASQPEWSTIIGGVVNGQIEGTADAVVYLPTAVLTPHPTFGYTVVSSKNLTLTNDNTGLTLLYTLYPVNVPVTVADQFNEPLTGMYDGLGVSEGTPNPPVWLSIGQTLTGGKYNDPVGIEEDYGYVPNSETDVIAGWAISSAVPINTGDEAKAPNPYSVEVGTTVIGGFSTRDMKGLYPNYEELLWP